LHSIIAYPSGQVKISKDRKHEKTATENRTSPSQQTPLEYRF